MSSEAQQPAKQEMTDIERATMRLEKCHEAMKRGEYRTALDFLDLANTALSRHVLIERMLEDRRLENLRQAEAPAAAVPEAAIAEESDGT